MGNVRIELNSSGIEQLLKSMEMQNCLGKHASDIANRAGGEFEVYAAPTRAVAEVRVANTSENMEKNTLMKAMR